MLKQAEHSLIAFLSDPKQRVFALKGPWGVGKSTFVRNFWIKRNTYPLTSIMFPYSDCRSRWLIV